MKRIPRMTSCQIARNGRRDGRTNLAAVRPLFFSLALVLIFSLCARAQGPVPFIANPLIPTTAVPGTQGLTLTVRGVGFTTGSVVNWNASPRATTFVSSTQLTAAILSSDLATATTGAITVKTPNVGASNIVFFPVNTAVPVTGTFRMDVGAGQNPTGVVIADFNGDGILDVAISSDYEGTVAVYIGKGNETFQKPVIYPVGNFPYNVVAGDVNNDGKLDLITPDLNSDMVSVLLGNGDGTFQPVKMYATGNNPQSIVLGDFNGDGNLDIATPNYFQNSVSVLLGNGDGSFRPPVNYSTGARPIDVKTADVNGDGILDLVVANDASNTISVLFGNGDGTFGAQQTYNTGLSPNAIAIADLNGDGFPDIVTSNGGSTISVLINAGNGTFLPRQDYQSGSYPSYVVQIVDINNDGKLDVLVPNFNCFQIVAYYGNGDGTLGAKPSVFTVKGQVDAMGIADLNGDGRLDIIALNEFANVVTLLTQSSLPQPGIAPAIVRFGSVMEGQQSAGQVITITNSTGSTLVINGINLAGGNPSDFSQTNNCPTNLVAGAKCTVTVIFAPLRVQTYNANLDIYDSSGTQAVFLQGAGVQ